MVQGEYTEFALSTVATSAHECQAAEVSGIKGGKLMCETRYDARSTRTTYKSSEQDAPTKSPVKQVVEPVAPAADWKPARKPRQQAAPSEDKSRPKPSSTGGRGGRGPSAGRGGRGPSAGRGGRG